MQHAILPVLRPQSQGSQGLKSSGGMERLGVGNCILQKFSHVRNVFPRNSGAGMAAPILWVPGFSLVLSAGKPPCP